MIVIFAAATAAVVVVVAVDDVVVVVVEKIGFHESCVQIEWFKALHINRGHLFNTMSLYDAYSFAVGDAAPYTFLMYADAGRDFEWSKAIISQNMESSKNLTAGTSSSPAHSSGCPFSSRKR
jgi:hypothetical protein